MLARALKVLAAAVPLTLFALRASAQQPQPQPQPADAAPVFSYGYATTVSHKKPMMAKQESVLESTARGTVPGPSAATVRLDAQPADGAVDVYYTLPPTEGQSARLELTDAQTGKVLFAGEVQGPDGRVTLPVPNPTAPHAARLITNHATVASGGKP